MKQLLLILCFLISPIYLFSQADSLQQRKLTFTADFRFRVEQDWDSRKSDGTYRGNRSRLRYRFRVGLHYQFLEWAEFGMRLRTGFREKQQDPQLTLGQGFKEFSTAPIGFEKLYFKASYKNLSGWLGKNTFPFLKQNELFWSDNVFPDGVFLSGAFPFNSSLIESLQFNGGHFILSASGNSFDEDQYFQGIQAVSSHLNNRINLYPSYYYFHHIPNIPDGNETYYLEYKILHLGAQATVLEKPAVKIGVDYYHNLENLKKNDSIPEQLKNQKEGVVVSASVGKLQKRGDWQFGTYFTYLERYSIVDFLAQNDWVRWDYSNQGSPDGRLSNYKGIEFRAVYLIRKNFKINVRYFAVEQLIPYSVASETGQRIRFDIDIGF